MHSLSPQPFSSNTSSVQQDLVDLKDEWVAKFARIEALLTRGTHQPVYSPVCMHVPHPPPTGLYLGHHLFNLLSLIFPYQPVWPGYSIGHQTRFCTSVLPRIQRGTLHSSLPYKIFIQTGHWSWIRNMNLFSNSLLLMNRSAWWTNWKKTSYLILRILN